MAVLHEELANDEDIPMNDIIQEQEAEYSDFESDDDDEDKLQPEPSKTAINNKEGLLEKLEDIAWPKDIDWTHKLTIGHELPEQVDVNDDLSRELAFYTQALEGTREAFSKLQSMNIPFLGPPDYYAEMVKTDSHMLKIKGKLLTQKKKIEEAEERKKAREAKKIAKEVQAQKSKERTKRKKEEIESVKKWRKQREQSGFAKGKGEEMEFDVGCENSKGGLKKTKRPGVGPGDRSGGLRMKGGFNKRRESKESRFGHGGRKGMKKQNTAETTSDLRGFNKGEFSGKKRKR